MLFVSKPEEWLQLINTQRQRRILQRRVVDLELHDLLYPFCHWARLPLLAFRGPPRSQSTRSTCS